MRHRGTVALAAASAVVIMTMIAPVASEPLTVASEPLTVGLQGENGVVRATEPGLSCADDGKGSYRHYLIDAPLAGGVMSKLTGKARATLDLHYDGDKALAAQGPNAFLLGTESHLTLSNERGSVQVALPAGSCAAPLVNFDGTTASGSGAWTNPAGTGAYRQVTGSGTFDFTAEMNPGADNAWRLNLNGSIAVLQPVLDVTVKDTYWGNLGLDYVTRVVTVVYQIRNTDPGDPGGPGDSFGTLFKSADPIPPPTPPKVTACGEPQSLSVSLQVSCSAGGPLQRPLGDLLSDETELVTVRYQISPDHPCAANILSCVFHTEVVVDMPDALDVSSVKSEKVKVTAPSLPPPL